MRKLSAKKKITDGTLSPVLSMASFKRLKNVMQHNQEKRSAKRLESSVPIILKASNGVAVEAYALDICESGFKAKIEYPLKNFADIFSERKEGESYTIAYNLPEVGSSNNVAIKLIWIQKSEGIDRDCYIVGCSLDANKSSDWNDFVTKIKDIKKLKTDESLKVIPTFNLLVNGVDVDTGKYEYFPYYTEMIRDFKTVFKTIKQLKQNEKIKNWRGLIHSKYCVGNEQVTENAIDAAYNAWLKYRFFSIEKRRKIFADIHDLLIYHRNKLIELFVVEGHPKSLADWEFSGMEQQFRIENLDYYTSEMKKKFRGVDDDVYVIRRPDGVVCVSPPKNASASNSMLAVFALLSGNTLVVKPPLKMPISTIYLWKNIVHRALKLNGCPDGCVNLIIGNSKQIMDQWMSSPKVKDIIFFGDSESGLKIAERGFARGKKVICELSGNDHLYVWKDADLKKSVASLIDAFLGSTQICMVPKNAIVHAEIFNTFLKQFKEEVLKLKIGLPNSSDTYMSPVGKISEFKLHLKDAVSKGAKVICGGKITDYDGLVSDRGMYVQPTILAVHDIETALNLIVFTKENFFPLIPVVCVSGETDDDIFLKMRELSERNDFGLRVSAWVKNKVYKDRFINEFHNSGLLRINSRHVDFSSFISSHGGTGNSGGPYGEMNYMWQKTSHLQGIAVK